jgi:hypothetical protein
VAASGGPERARAELPLVVGVVAAAMVTARHRRAALGLLGTAVMREPCTGSSSRP